MEKGLFTVDNYPSSYLLKQDLRSKELQIHHLIRAMGDILGLGYGVIYANKFEPETVLPTGQGLCVLTATIAESALRKKFTNLVVETEIGRVLSFNAEPQKRYPYLYFEHAWNELQFPDEPALFLDLVFGQVNPWLNRIVLDQVVNKDYYYPELNPLGEYPRDTINNCLRSYHGISKTITGRTLSQSEKRRLRVLAHRTEALIAA